MPHLAIESLSSTVMVRGGLSVIPFLPPHIMDMCSRHAKAWDPLQQEGIRFSSTHHQEVRLTNHRQDLVLDVRLDVNPAPALGVVCPAEARHVRHAALVDVHHAS